MSTFGNSRQRYAVFAVSRTGIARSSALVRVASSAQPSAWSTTGDEDALVVTRSQIRNSLWLVAGAIAVLSGLLTMLPLPG